MAVITPSNKQPESVISLVNSPDCFEARLLYIVPQPTIMRKVAMSIGIPMPSDTLAKQAQPSNHFIRLDGMHT